MLKREERVNHMATKEESQTALKAIEAVRTEVAKAESASTSERGPSSART